MATTEELLRYDAEHIVHPLYAIGQNRGLMFKRAEGACIEDADGRTYLDFSAQLDCVNLGYGRRELVDTATKAMQETSFFTNFFALSHQASVECAMALGELTPPGLDHFFFSAGGSESVEASLIFARRFWQNAGKPNKYKILSQYACYHGVTFAARSLTNMGAGGLDMGLVQKVPGFLHVPNYYCYRCMFGQTYPECGLRCVDFIADVIRREGPDNVAAFIAEPVMGAEGMVPPPPGYWEKIREVCTSLDVLLIADEVMTGFCRTGKTFAVVRRVAKAIGCSDPTLTRVLAGKTLPSDDLMKHGGLMFDLGFKRYSRLSASERGTLSEKIGVVSGGVLGFAAITAAIEAAGITGVSAAGISSGLAALGRLVGGGMCAGVSVAAALPLAGGLFGYGVSRGVKYHFSKEQLNSTDIDNRWEIMRLDGLECPQ